MLGPEATMPDMPELSREAYEVLLLAAAQDGDTAARRLLVELRDPRWPWRVAEDPSVPWVIREAQRLHPFLD
jgi:hypothetical protein